MSTYTESPVTSSTEWLSGCNMAYKREVFEHLEFDWKLLKYSYSEDVDFSFRIFKKYGRGSIYILSDAKLVHNQSSSGRLLGYPLEAHRRIVNLYMLYKHFGDTPLNIIVFMWWNIGEIIEYLMSGILRRRFRDNLKKYHGNTAGDAVCP